MRATLAVGLLFRSEFAVSRQVLLEIFQRVVVHLTLFQKAVQLIPGTNTEQGAKLVAGETLPAVRFEGDRFKSSAGGVLAGRRERGSKIVGNLDRDLHDHSLAQVAGRGQQSNSVW